VGRLYGTCKGLFFTVELRLIALPHEISGDEQKNKMIY